MKDRLFNLKEFIDKNGKVTEKITYTNGDDEYVIDYLDINNAVTHILYKHTIYDLFFSKFNTNFVF